MGIKERFLGIVRSEERDIAEGGFYMTDFKSKRDSKKPDAGICRRESGKESLYNCGKAGESR